MQVLYTLPHGSKADDATVSEAGAMNVFFVFDKASQWLFEDSLVQLRAKQCR